MNDNEEKEELLIKPDAQSHFAWLRTLMSADQSLEAWIRTAVSLIVFGFTIVQFFAIFRGMGGVAPPRHPLLPNYIGLALIGLGTGSLILALWQHRMMQRHLHSAQFQPLFGSRKLPEWSPAFWAGVGCCIVGVFAFAAVLLRVMIW